MDESCGDAGRRRVCDGCHGRTEIRTCPGCGKDAPKGSRYCSKECRYRANGTMRICQQCGREFHRVMKYGRDAPKYCSQKCQWEAQIKRPFATCQTCGKEFRVGRECKGMFCSPECQWESMRVSHESERGFAEAVKWMESLSRAIVQGERTLIAVGCENCGKGFVTTSGRARFCSDRCRKRHKNRLKDERIYWYGEPDKDITLEKVFLRDGGKCRSCGAILSFKGSPQGDLYPSVDHAVPLSKGGTHTWGNVQLMCRGCNRTKNDALNGPFATGMAWFEA